MWSPHASLEGFKYRGWPSLQLFLRSGYQSRSPTALSLKPFAKLWVILTVFIPFAWGNLQGYSRWRGRQTWDQCGCYMVSRWSVYSEGPLNAHTPTASYSAHAFWWLIPISYDGKEYARVNTLSASLSLNIPTDDITSKRKVRFIEWFNLNCFKNHLLDCRMNLVMSVTYVWAATIQSIEVGVYVSGKYVILGSSSYSYIWRCASIS
jgi:hypothetical protein